MKNFGKTLIILCGLLFTNASFAVDPFGIFRSMEKSIETLEKVDKTQKAIKKTQDTVDHVQKGVGAVNTYRSLNSLNGASPIFSGVREVYINVDAAPAKGDAAEMSRLVQEVLCRNLHVIVNNLAGYKMRGASPKCIAGSPSGATHATAVLMRLTQVRDRELIEVNVQYIEHATGAVLKELAVPQAKNYYEVVKYTVSNLHGDLLTSSKHSDAYAASQWPKRFHSYSKKSKHYKVVMRSKERKQLVKNKAV